MRRRIAIGLLAAGTLLGFASGFHSLHRCRAAQRAAFEHDIASACVEAARRGPSPAPSAE